MTTEREESNLEPTVVELKPEQAEIPDTLVQETHPEDRRHLRPPLPRGPFRPVTDLGEETTVEETERGTNRS